MANSFSMLEKIEEMAGESGRGNGASGEDALGDATSGGDAAGKASGGSGTAEKGGAGRVVPRHQTGEDVDEIAFEEAAAQVERGRWESLDSAAKRINGRKNYDAKREAAEKRGEYAQMVRKVLKEAGGIPTRVDHAYTPNERASYGGGEHLVTLEDFKRGQLKRSRLSPFCKPANKFWGLTHTHGGPPTCSTCMKRAERLASEALSRGKR